MILKSPLRSQNDAGAVHRPFSAAAAFGLLLSVLHFPVFPQTQSFDDTLAVFAAGDALATYQRPSGFKGSENGFLRVSVCQEMADCLSALVGIRGYSALPEPFLETAALAWKNGSGGVAGGFLTSRYGICKFYKAYSTLGPLFERPIVWNAYGFGGSGRLRAGNWAFEGSALLNDRESGSVHAYTGLELQAFSTGILAGFQTYSPEDQDNNYTFGFESFAEEGPVRLHCAMKYLHGTPWPDIGPGNHPHGSTAGGFIEARIAPCRPLTIDLLGLYESSRRLFTRESGLAGLDCQWRLVNWWGVAGGGEWSNSSGIVSWAPELRTFVAPDSGLTQLSIGVKQSRTRKSSPLYQVIGTICIAF